MFRFISGSLVLLILLFVVIFLSRDPGYVLFSYGKYTLEMPLWLMIFTNAITFICLYFVVKTLHIMRRISKLVPNWMQSRRRKRAHKQTYSGMVAHREGKWGIAEKNLSNAAANSVSPMLNYLLAAKSAHELGDLKKREEYLVLAHAAADDDDLAVQFTKAKLYKDSQQFEEALSILMSVLANDPKNKYANDLIKEIYIELENWQELILVLPKLYKISAINVEELRKLETIALGNMLSKSLLDNKLDVFKTLYSEIPKYLRTDVKFIHMQATYLIKIHEQPLAEKLLEKALKSNWSDKLMELYGDIDSIDKARQLKIAEGFLRLHNNSAALHAALGRISVSNRLWGKARSYFEESLHIIPSIFVYSLLGDLLNVIGEYELSSQCYKKGISLTSKTN